MKTMIKHLLIGAFMVVCLTALTFVGAGAECSCSFIDGTYGGNPENFSPVGSVSIEWDTEVSNKLNLRDGDITDWIKAGYSPTHINRDNMVMWVIDEIPEQWAIDAYFVADEDYLYIAFDVTDSDFVYGSGGKYDGDAIQFVVDFGNRIAQAHEDEEIERPSGVFYSFSCDSDGAPIRVWRQESAYDGLLDYEYEVVGSTCKTEKGWFAEFSLAWSTLEEDSYDTLYYKNYRGEQPWIVFGGEYETTLDLGISIFYLNRTTTTTGSSISWAAGTTNGYEVNGKPQISWSTHDNGIQLKLFYEKNMQLHMNHIINNSQGFIFTSNGDGTCFVSGIVSEVINDSEIVIPSTSPDGDIVVGIGERAFSGCSRLTSITIPEGVTSIGYSAFSDCISLRSIIIPEGVTSIGSSAFSGCSSLTSITIPESVTNIGDSVFSGCSSLTSITIPESVTIIGNSSFSDCISLTSVTIPEGVTHIGSSAFSGCSRLTSITIPEGVIFIGGDAFEGCDKLIQVENDIGYVDKWVVNCDRKIKKAILREDTVGIASDAFANCLRLVVIIIPDGVTSIGNSAFYGCRNLTNITIPEGVRHIGSSAFSGCSSLTSIIIPEGVTSIHASTFSNCSSLTSITIPEGVTSIYFYAFSGCSSLTSVSIPKSIIYIDPNHNVFRGCNSLTDIYCFCTEADWNSITSESDQVSLPNVTIHFLSDAEIIENTVTCTEAGQITYKCECGATYTLEKAPIDHLWEESDWYITVAPGCLIQGEERRDCQRENCTHYETKTIPATGHTPGDWTTVTEPAIGTEGKKQQSCTVCGEILNEEPIPALPEETEPETNPVTDPETAPVTDPETTPVTEPETQPETAPATDVPPETTPDTTEEVTEETTTASDGQGTVTLPVDGCSGSILSCGLLMLVALVGAVLIKRKE